MGKFLSEVVEQPAAMSAMLAELRDDQWQRELREITRSRRAVVFVGMGASLYASIPAALYLAMHGIPAHWLDAGELLHYSWPAIARDDTAVIFVSQSGESYEVVALAERLRQARHDRAMVAVTNYPGSRLAGLCPLVLPLRAGEEAGTSSKTYLNSLAMLMLVAAACVGTQTERWRRELGRVAGELAATISAGQEAGRAIADFLGSPLYLPIIGRGPSAASAMDAALVLKEVVALGAEGFTGGAFRHGPFEMIAHGLPAVIFASGRGATLGMALAAKIADHDGKAVVVAPREVESPRSTGILPVRIACATEWLMPMLEIVPIQFLAIEWATRRGREPGELRVSGKVVREE